ncbi:MAG: TetR/AcrR family transcriptional regulator [bacterium]|nr:TetR/AcrR family transcriptional regulator [bacterium]
MTEARRSRRRQEDLDEILDAALELFVAQGFHGTSMQQIAEKVDFSVGKLYTLFPSKEDLFRSIQARGLQEMVTIFENVIDGDTPPLVALLNVLQTGFDFAMSKRGIIRVEVAERLGRTMNTDRPVRNLFMGRIRDLLDRAVAAGDLRPLDTHLLATMLMGAGEAIVEELASREDADPYADIPDRIMELMVLPHLNRGEVSR